MIKSLAVIFFMIASVLGYDFHLEEGAKILKRISKSRNWIGEFCSEDLLKIFDGPSTEYNG
jgi:hypothetical protein